MIDTIELKTNFKSKDKSYILKGINNFIKDLDIYYYDSKGRYQRPKLLNKYETENKSHFYRHSSAFTYRGIIDLAIETINVNYPKCVLTLKYKPAKFLYPDDRYALSEEKDFQEAYNNLQEFLIELNDYIADEIEDSEDIVKKWHIIPDIEDWKITQIHYAIEESTPFFEVYHKLLHISTGNFKYATSIYQGNQSTLKNFYDKTVEQEVHCNIDIASCSSHVVRYEIQCKKKFISHQVSDGNIPKASLYHLWSKKIAYRIIKIALRDVFGTGEIYSLDAAKTILAKNFSPSKAAKLCLFLEFTQDFTKAEAIERMAAILNTTPSKIRRNILASLTKTGIATIALPKGVDINVLANPINLLN